jgi:MFS family permease
MTPLRRLLTARFLSACGDLLVPVAAPFAVLDDLHGGAAQIGLVLAAEFVGVLTFVVFGGAITDRAPPVRVMVRADLAGAGFQAATAALLASGVMTIPLFAILMFAQGGATAFFGPAVRVLVPQVAEAGGLQRANGLLGTVSAAATIVGPVLGGVLVAWPGAPGAFAVNALSFGVSLALTRGLVSTPGAKSVGLRLREGWGEVAGRPWLGGSILVAAGTELLASGPLATAIPLVSRRIYGGASSYGWLLSALGVGAVLGGLAAARLPARRPVLAANLLIVPLAVVPLALRLEAPFGVALPAFALGGACQAAAGVMWNTALGLAVPRSALGRVASWDMLGSFASRPLGQAFGGVLAGAAGTGPLLLLATASLVAVPLPILALRDVRAPSRAGRPDASQPAPQPG